MSKSNEDDISRLEFDSRITANLASNDPIDDDFTTTGTFYCCVGGLPGLRSGIWNQFEVKLKL